MARIKNKSLEKEIDRAMTYIYMGTVKMFEDEDNDRESIKEKIVGKDMVLSGASILNSLSRIKAKEGEAYFPTKLKDVLYLIKNHGVDEWVEMYPFLKNHCNDLVSKGTQFYHQAYLEREDRDIVEDSEYKLFVKFNNDMAFSEIRNIAKNDKEYSFSRAYISPILEGELLELKKNIDFKYIKMHGESISETLLNEILKNYYRPITNLHIYYSENGRYALCKSCGSLMKKKRNGDIVCSFNKCRNSHFMKNKKFEILEYCSNPTMILKYEVMRFVYYPSIEEREMFNKLTKKYLKKELIRDLILYKDKDSCDISFYIGNIREAVDLKEWESPEELAKSLNTDNFKRNNADANCTIVIPDYLTKKSNGRKNDYMQRLKASITGDNMKDVKIMTVSEFFKYVDSCIIK